MTVANPASFNLLQGDGVTTVFGYTFTLPAGSTGTDIYVYVIDSDGDITLLTSNYTLNIQAATITYPVVGGITPLGASDNTLPSGWQLGIFRIESLTQALNLVTQGPFPAAGIMAALDFLTLITQQLQEQINRCVKYPIGQVPTSTDVNAFITAVSAAINPAATVAAYSVLKAQAVTTPGTPFFGVTPAGDISTNASLVFYTGNTAVGDQGFIVLGGG